MHYSLSFPLVLTHSPMQTADTSCPLEMEACRIHPISSMHGWQDVCVLCGWQNMLSCSLCSSVAEGEVASGSPVLPPDSENHLPSRHSKDPGVLLLHDAWLTL